MNKSIVINSLVRIAGAKSEAKSAFARQNMPPAGAREMIY
jgi:hypothetical protein